MVTGPTLEFTRLAMVVEPEDPASVPLYTAPAIRGAFGNRLRRLSCLVSTLRCEGCGLKRHCPYGRIFETDNVGVAKRLKGAKHAPHPFAFKIPRVDGRQLALSCALVGRAIDDLPILVAAFEQLAAGFTVGDGKDFTTLRFEIGGRFARAADGCDYRIGAGEVWPSSRRLAVTLSDLARDEDSRITVVALSFVSPTHVVTRGHACERFELEPFVRRLLTRLEVLSDCYCAGPPAGPEWFDGLLFRFRELTVRENQTSWAEASRYSSRHRQEVPLGGFVGRVVLEGDLGDVLPVLRAGEVLGVGKNTSSGCGDYELAFA